MGFIGSTLGMVSGSTGGAGLNFDAAGTNVQNPTTSEQALNSYQQANSAIQKQQDFLDALNTQNGIGNQSQVFQQQQALANQLQGVANGTGPNPALAQLNQATGANVANQAALMAGQRGTSANAGLLARQAAMQGAGIQQQAAGQGATMQAQQQLAAMGQLQGQQANMAGLSSAQVGQQAAGIQGYNQQAQSEQQILLNALDQQNKNNVAMQSNMNNANADISKVAADQQGKLLSGQGNSAGMAMMADGGAVSAPPAAPTVQAAVPNNPAKSFVGRFLYGTQSPSDSPSQQPMPAQNSGHQDHLLVQGVKAGLGALFGNSTSSADTSGSAATIPGGGTSLGDMVGAGGDSSYGDMISAMGMAKGGKVPAKVSPGEVYIPPSKTKAAAAKENPMSEGKKIPGKAKVKGDSLKNDTVSATLQSGGIVIPRSIVNAKDAPKKAAEFVRAIMAKKGLG